MGASFRSNFKAVQRAARKGVSDGLTAVAVQFQNEVQLQLNKHASNGGNPAPIGGPPGNDTGTLARSWQGRKAVVDKSNLRDQLRPRMTVGSNLKYARIHEFGGVITAKNGALAIPVHPKAKAASAKGQGPRQAFGDELDYIERPGKPPLLVRFMEGRGKRGDMWEIMYVLKPSVRLPARPYVRPAVQLTQPKAAGIAQPFLTAALARFK